MPIDLIFSVVNFLVLPQWLLMMVLPHWKGTRWLVSTWILPILLSVFYLFFLFTAEGLDFGEFSSLDGLTRLFQNKALVLGGWIHYLAFDLVVGSWILQDSQGRGINHWLVVPCLLLCLMMGPAGFLLYQIIRRAKAN